MYIILYKNQARKKRRAESKRGWVVSTIILCKRYVIVYYKVSVYIIQYTIKQLTTFSRTVFVLAKGVYVMFSVYYMRSFPLHLVHRGKTSPIKRGERIEGSGDKIRMSELLCILIPIDKDPFHRYQPRVI